MNKDKITETLKSRTEEQAIRLLLIYGHELTIQARWAYEFQGSGVDDPRLLRDCNEIQHRVFQALQELVENREKKFSFSHLGSWISAEERNEKIRNASIQAFNRAIEKCT